MFSLLIIFEIQKREFLNRRSFSTLEERIK